VQPVRLKLAEFEFQYYVIFFEQFSLIFGGKYFHLFTFGKINFTIMGEYLTAEEEYELMYGEELEMMNEFDGE
jgi:hypothetical protein